MKKNWFHLHIYVKSSFELNEFLPILRETLILDKELRWYLCLGDERGTHIKIFLYSSINTFKKFCQNTMKLFNFCDNKVTIKGVDENPFFNNHEIHSIKFGFFQSDLLIRRNLPKLNYLELLILNKIIEFFSKKSNKLSPGNILLRTIAVLKLILKINPNIAFFDFGKSDKETLELIDLYRDQINRYFLPFDRIVNDAISELINNRDRHTFISEFLISSNSLLIFLNLLKSPAGMENKLTEKLFFLLKKNII
jgi:hypothetical protein